MRCILGHKWSNWTQYTINIIVYIGEYGLERRQNKVCLRCGKIKSQKIY